MTTTIDTMFPGDEIRLVSAVYLVGCSDTKRVGPCLARELYTGDLFLKARAYVQARQAEWYILSAKYGLLHPDDPVDYYNLHIRGLSLAQRRAWAERVRAAMTERDLMAHPLICFAGKTYRTALELPPGVHVEAPLEGLGIGQQLGWFKARETSARATTPACPLFDGGR